MTEQVALVTGGANGIGAAAVDEFLQNDWFVVLLDLDITGIDEDIRNNKNVLVLQANICEQNSVKNAVEQAVNEFGHIDALINNAGIQRWSTMEDLDLEAWQEVLNTNLYGSLFCLHAVGQKMLARSAGSIVNVVSILAETAVSKRGPYSASKSALMSVTRTAAVEWGKRGVRVNGVGPGYVETPLMDSYYASGKIDKEDILTTIPMGRMASPQEIANVIFFLASVKASYVTGQTFFVDGGFLANSGIDVDFD